jgi:NAD-dependent DNA ligase
MNPDQRRVLRETADELDTIYEKHAHEIRMLGLNDLYDALTKLRKYAERLREEAREDEELQHLGRDS